jgi:soluble lytic murein transglycosylase-like protein
MYRPLAVLVALALLAPAAAHADIYQYTDKDGVIHFTSAPPGVSGAKLVVRGGGNSATGARPGVVPFMPQDRDVVRFTRYDDWIRQAATLYQIPEALVRAVIKVESDYDPRAVSVSGARGLMQLMPDTATSMQVKDIDDPRENIFGGVKLLRILANTFNGDLELTVAAYNAGPDSVMKYGGIPPYQQTRDYVVKVSAYYRRFRSTPDVAAAALGGG